MRFSLKTLMLAMLFIAVFTAIAVWNPLFGGLIALVGGPIALLSFMLWNHPFALLICTLSATTLLLETSIGSYNGTRAIHYKPHETFHAVYFTQGRLLFFRYEKWLPPVQSRFYVEPPVTDDWKKWDSYPPPGRDVELAGCEYASGNFTYFITSVMRHHSFDYTMIGIPIWLIAALMLAPAVGRLVSTRIWSNRRSGPSKTTIQQAPSDASVKENRAALVEKIFRRIALVSIVISIFLIALIAVVRLDLPARPTELPDSYLIFIHLLLLTQVILAYLHENRLPRKFNRIASVAQYVLIAALALLIGSEFWILRVEIMGPLSEDTIVLLFGLRFAFSFLICLDSVIMSQPWKRPSQNLMKWVALATTAACFTIPASTLAFDFQSLRPSQFIYFHDSFMGLAIISLLAQAAILAIAFAEIEKDPPLTLLFLGLILAFVAGLILLEPHLQTNPTPAKLIKGIWQFRAVGLLAVSGICTFLLINQSERRKA